MGSTLSQSGRCRNKQVEEIGTIQERRDDILTDNMVSVVNILLKHTSTGYRTDAIKDMEDNNVKTYRQRL